MTSKTAGRRARGRDTVLFAAAPSGVAVRLPAHSADPDTVTDQLETATPIEQVIGENRTFDLAGRSRDNLPNPRPDRDNPFVPVNGPAIGDLFDMFAFGRQGENGSR
jgi:hypothetical protein